MMFLFAIITSRMEQNFHQQFESQSEIIKSVVHDVCAVLIENFKAIFDEKKKNRCNNKFWEYMLQQDVTSLKQVNLKVHNDVEVLEQKTDDLV